MSRITIKDITRKKGKEKIVMLTCYDYSFAKILDESGIDIILVGDSLANVVLGLDETRKVPLGEMFNHTKAVALAVDESLVVADMPYRAYQNDPVKCVDYARRFIKSGADAVKVEWFLSRGFHQTKESRRVLGQRDCVYVVKKLIKNKIPVMGHIGLTPQTAHLLGGYKVQGKDQESALGLLKQAEILQDLGVFSIVLECIPYQVSRIITEHLKIPTIGIGAGKYCDGQVLVLYDILGLYTKRKPKFVKVYRDLSSETKGAIFEFAEDVKKKKFPHTDNSFAIDESILKKIVLSPDYVQWEST